MKSIGLDLWVLQKENKVPLFGDIRATMTVVRTMDGRVILISPVAMSAQEAQAVRLLGRVQWIVAPNPLHHLHLESARAHFPEAELWGPLKLIEKRRDLEFAGVLSPATPAPWEAELHTIHLHAEAPVYEEMIFFHPRSRTAILTDLAFHLQEPGSWWNRLFVAINGGLGRLATTRMGRRTFRDLEAVADLRRRLAEWNAANVVVAHGEPIVGSAAAPLQTALAWAVRS